MRGSLTVSLLGRAMQTTKREIFLSLKLLLLIWIVLSAIYFIAEHMAQPDVYDLSANGLWKSFLWTFVKCISDPGEMAPPPPITFCGKIVANIIGLIGIALFAVPAGLIGSGFTDAMSEDKHKKDIERFHDILLQDQKLTWNRNLKLFLQSLPQNETAWYYGCQFKYIHNNTRVSRYQLKGIELKGIIEVCNTYPGFRVKDIAMATTYENENRAEVYVLEPFPVNKPYGCFINRGSKVTIISTSSRSELNTGNFAFYLAKWAGFNYISKDYDADENDGESYFNNPWLETTIDGKSLLERVKDGRKLSKAMHELYGTKEAHRAEFLKDLQSVTSDADSWAICMLSQMQNKENDVDIHIAHNTVDGEHEVIHDLGTYQRLLSTMTTFLNDNLGLKTEESSRYPLIYEGKDKPRNLVYKLQEMGCKCNGMTIRVSSHLMEFDSNMRIAEFLMAKSIKDTIESTHPLPKDDVEDMNRIGYGYMQGREYKQLFNYKELKNYA